MVINYFDINNYLLIELIYVSKIRWLLNIPKFDLKLGTELF